MACGTELVYVVRCIPIGDFDYANFDFDFDYGQQNAMDFDRMHAARRVGQLSMQMAPLGKWPADWLPLEGIALLLPKVQQVPAERERER